MRMRRCLLWSFSAPFMWDLRAQVQTASNNLQLLAVALRGSDLKKNFRVGEQDGVALSLQVKYISQTMTAILTQATSFHDFMARLVAFKKLFVADESAGNYEAPVMEDLKKCGLLIDPPLTNFGIEKTIGLEGCLGEPREQSGGWT